MAIIETRVYTRPSNSVPFYHETNTAIYQAHLSRVADLKTSGALAVSNTIVDNTLTVTLTFDSLETMSQNDTSVNVEYDNECVSYMTNNGITMEQYSITGIDQPFTMTCTYTSPDGSATGPQILAHLGQQASTDCQHLASTSAPTENTLIVQNQFGRDIVYTNCYGTDGFMDRSALPNMQAAGITRNVVYALVTSG
jgi:hypothetical protein